jgi:hypothetical protein
VTTTLGAPDGRRALCLKAYERIAHALPDLTVFAVLGSNTRAALFWTRGRRLGRLPDWYLPELIANVERKDYEVKHVLRTLRPRYSGDTSAAEMRASTRSLAASWRAARAGAHPADAGWRGAWHPGGGQPARASFAHRMSPSSRTQQMTGHRAGVPTTWTARTQILTSGALMREGVALRIATRATEQPAERMRPLLRCTVRPPARIMVISPLPA